MNKQLRVYWIPQVPMTPFHVAVDSVDEGAKLMNTLANYDLFQLEHDVKPDYCNNGGLELYEDGEWVDWYSEEYSDVDDYMATRDGFA